MNIENDLTPIEDAPGYFISKNGKVISRVGQKEREMTQDLNSDGYPSVRIYINGKRKRMAVHKLLGRAFLPKPPGSTMVRHLDDNKLNNSLSNLAWGNNYDNMQDMVRNGGSTKGKPRTWSFTKETQPRGDTSTYHKLSSKDVIYIRKAYKRGVRSIELARKFKVIRATICNAISGRSWGHILEGLPE